MLLRVAVLLLLAACAWAISWRANFVVDQLLRAVGADQIPLHDISFDVDHNDTFPGYVEFHLTQGNLLNLHRRVRRKGDCNVSGHDKPNPTYAYVYCHLDFRGVVARYNVEVIANDQSTRAVAEVVADSCKFYYTFFAYPAERRKDTELYFFHRSSSLTSKLKPLRLSLDLPNEVIKKFEEILVPQAQIEIARALNTTYKQVLAEKTATLKFRDITG